VFSGAVHLFCITFFVLQNKQQKLKAFVAIQSSEVADVFKVFFVKVSISFLLVKHGWNLSI
jgi:hypothetical protein